MDRDQINAIGKLLQSVRQEDESIVVVSFAAHGPCSDTPAGSVSVTAQRGLENATYEAVGLADALHGVRGLLDRMAAKRVKEAEEAKSAVLAATA